MEIIPDRAENWQPVENIVDRNARATSLRDAAQASDVLEELKSPHSTLEARLWLHLDFHVPLGVKSHAAGLKVIVVHLPMHERPCACADTYGHAHVGVQQRPG